MGAKPKSGGAVSEVGKALLARASIKKLLPDSIQSGFTVDSLTKLMKEIVNQDDAWDLLAKLLDCGFWALVAGLAKFGAKLTPGVGQALWAASIALFVHDLLLKVAKGPNEAA